MDYLCNNRKNQPHEKSTALAPSTTSIHLIGKPCGPIISCPAKVASSVRIDDGPNRVQLVQVAQEKRGHYDGKPTRIFFGKHFKSENLSRTDAMTEPLYSRFFAKNGRIKRQNLLRAV